MSTILVTGANGFVGRTLVDRLVRKSTSRVIATDVQWQPQENDISGRDEAVVFYSGDLTEPSFCEHLFAEHQFDAIVHLAGVLSQKDDDATRKAIYRVNVTGTFNLLEAAKAQRPRFIFPSTALVYGNQKPPFTEDMKPRPGDFYAVSKRMCEELIQLYHRRNDLPYVIFRPSVLYGPGQEGGMFIPSVVRSLVAGDHFAMTAGAQKRDFLHVDDFVTAMLLAITDDDLIGTYNVANGVSQRMKDVALLAQSLAGHSDLIQLGAIPYRANEVWDYGLSTDRIVARTGWRPAVTLEEGLRQCITACRRELSC